MDLQLVSDKSRFPEEIKIDELQSSSSVSSLTAAIVNPATPISGNHEDPDEDDGYKTPTSEENRIPAPEYRVCPLTPRKRIAVNYNDVSPAAKKISRRRVWMRRRESAMLLKMIEFEFSEIMMSTGFNMMD